MILALILGAIWALFSFFSWLIGVTPAILTTFAYGMIGITIYLLFAFVWQILWKFFHKASDKFNEGTSAEHLGFKSLHLVLVLILGVIWTLFNFFTWLTGVGPTILTNYAYGIIGVTIYLLFAFIWQILWTFFHKVSEKL